MRHQRKEPSRIVGTSLRTRGQNREPVTEQSTLVMEELGNHQQPTYSSQDTHMRGTVSMRNVGEDDRRDFSNKNTAEQGASSLVIGRFTAPGAENVFPILVVGLGVAGMEGGIAFRNVSRPAILRVGVHTLNEKFAIGPVSARLTQRRQRGQQMDDHLSQDQLSADVLLAESINQN